ncbi:LysR family transcriptional regulator [Kineosporia sp. NBRC 101731]|uniref:LysR family transcriptional regulator n=1 Tax=Kineosporia sp. NBRC 101731 TaxID=3032199 RepID=UPI0024A5AFB1|nr:LysR family transcriptional regulator [Kineosporia sp. NBRC 101731]GLY33776.1 LysR family transcriptional regulator [Kineosporia sp. NBRC 101731]
MDVQQLKVLAEVARTGSYTAAAASLGYTQPAVSYQMRRLQQSLGAPVVVRVGRGLQLTELGEVLLQHADNVFSVIRAVEQDMSSAVARGGGLVRVVAFQSGLIRLLPPVIDRLRVSHPNIRISVTQAEPVEARRLIRSGEVELGLLCNWANEDLPEGESTMLRRELITDRRCVVMPAGHALAQRKAIDLTELADQNWVMESFRDRFMAACTNAGFSPRIVATVDDVLTVQALVASGMGISMMNELGLLGHTRPDLVYRPLRDWPLRRTYALLWPDMARVPAVGVVLHEIQAVARAVRKNTPGRPVPAPDLTGPPPRS